MELKGLMMKPNLRHRNFFVVLGMDLFLLVSAIYLAHFIRFDFNIPPHTRITIIRWLPFILIIKFGSFYFFDLYRGMWRYTSISDLFNIIKAASASTLVVISLVLFSKTRFIGVSRSVFVIDWCFTIFFISGFRVCIRLYFERLTEDQSLISALKSFVKLIGSKSSDNKRLIIIGAGDGGEKIYRELRDNVKLCYDVVAFLDDNTAKVGKKIHGIPVMGSTSELKAIADKVKADEALIAIPSATSSQMRNIVSQCKASGIDFKTIPGMGELINGKVTVSAIREVDYRDLLGREVISLDREKIGAYLKGQNVFVTGAGGSIGSELCRQICRFHPETIILFEIAETPLHDIDLELKQSYKHIEIIPVLADVRDKQQLEKAFVTYTPKTVFHAAAYKHVPMLEFQPWRAIDNNILGTINVVEMANKFNVERFVFISTDKAVRPVNVMGASKRVVEMIVQSQNGCGISNTRFMIVRFGNVVGSVGSVVPLFTKQISKGGPVTVTHPEMTRYFMTIPEACQLILQAGAMGSGGEIFLFDMGTPIKIDDMARDLIRLTGFEPGIDIEIEYIGLRPGEKLYEELIVEGENTLPTSHEKIMVLKGIECNLEILNGKIEELSLLAENQDAEKIREKLKEIVTEYNPPQRNGLRIPRGKHSTE